MQTMRFGPFVPRRTWAVPPTTRPGATLRPLPECYSLAVTIAWGWTMRRREFLGVLGGAAAWPLPLRAQQPAMPVVGYLSALSETQVAHQLAAFRCGLSEVGFVEGQNVVIEFRWAEGRYDRLPALAAELVRRPVESSLPKLLRPPWRPGRQPRLFHSS
jgi:hypothetical protein